jgi:hypothetical protein
MGVYRSAGVDASRYEGQRRRENEEEDGKSEEASDRTVLTADSF